VQEEKKETSSQLNTKTSPPVKMFGAKMENQDGKTAYRKKEDVLCRGNLAPTAQISSKTKQRNIEWPLIRKGTGQKNILYAARKGSGMTQKARKQADRQYGGAVDIDKR